MRPRQSITQQQKVQEKYRRQQQLATWACCTSCHAYRTPLLPSFSHSPFSSCRLFQTFLAICNASKLGQIIKSKSYTHVPKYTLKIFFPFCFQTKKLNNVIQNEFIGATIKINKYENKLISIKKKRTNTFSGQSLIFLRLVFLIVL